MLASELSVFTLPCEGFSLSAVRNSFAGSLHSSVFVVFLCRIIVMTTQYLTPALHKNFSEADFDFKVKNSFCPIYLSNTELLIISLFFKFSYV